MTILETAYKTRRPKMSTNHRYPVLFFAVALTCLLLGGALSAYFVSKADRARLDDAAFLQRQIERLGDGSAMQKTRKRPPSLVRVAEADRRKIGSMRHYTGRLVEVQIAKISSEVAGLVVELPIEVGMRVKGGETLIAQTDKTWLELSVEQNEAEIKTLAVQAAHQQAELERMIALAVSRAVSESELNNQRTIAEQFIRNLEKARITNRELREKIKRTTILAPFDGYVVKREVGLGELLSPGAPIAEIVSLGDVDAMVNVGEVYIDRIKLGDEIPIIIDPLRKRLVGKVRTIVPYAPTAARMFPLLVRLSDQDGLLKVGMSVTAEIQTTDPMESIVVLKDAVLDKPEGAVVWVVVDGEGDSLVAKPVPVRFTAKEIEHYGVEPETEEGRRLLVAGVRTVIEGAERLMPNQVVRVTGIAPKILEDLPPVTGQKVIDPKKRIEGGVEQ